MTPSPSARMFLFDYRGKTTSEVSADEQILALGVVVLVNLLLMLLAWRLLERKRARDMWCGAPVGDGACWPRRSALDCTTSP